MASNRLSVKYSVSPSGVVKCSHGAGNVKSVRSAYGLGSPCQSFQTSRLPIGADEIYDPNSDVPPPPVLRCGHGLLGNKSFMSAKSAKNLRERMVAVELEYGKENCFFATLTLPTDYPRAYEMLARYSSFCINRLGVWLSDNMHSEFARVGVWEYQKRGAPHYHFVLGSDCIHAMNISEFRSKLAAAWMSILESVGHESDCEMFLSGGKLRDKKRLMKYDDLGQRFANVQIVEKSVAAYLSSYLSGSNHDKKNKKNKLRKDFFPIASWGQWNRKATELFKKYSLEYECQIWAEHYDDWSALNDVLLASVEKAEKTEVLSRKNPWWNSIIFIAKEGGDALISTVSEIIKGLKNMDISPKLFDDVRIESAKKKEREWERDGLIHDAEFVLFERAYLQKKMIKNMGSKLVICLAGLQSVMIRCEKEIKSHKKFDFFLKNHHQLEITNAS